MADIQILVSELAMLFQKPFDIPFKTMLTNSAIGYRATILKQEYDKNGKYPLGSEDSLCLPLTRVNPIECCLSDGFECVVTRTKDKVPSPVRGNFKPDPFLYVGSSNMTSAFMYAQPSMVENILSGTKFIKNEKLYSFFNDYIYVFNFEGGKLGVRDVFSNPLELLTLKSCSGQPCITSINIEDDMKRVIKQMIIEEQRSMGNIIEDQSIKINEDR